MTYSFLQHYWWFLVSLLGALLVFLMFVQGANSMLFSLGRTEAERRLLVNSTGRKWEFTFTTLVTFGGAFFASFPLFYSTSFGGAYWVWMIILFSFVVQAVSYEFQNKLGNLLGARTFQTMLVVNGVVGPLLLGMAVAGGLDAVADPWNVVLGLAVFFLSRVLGLLYTKNNINDEVLSLRISRRLIIEAACFLVFFLLFLVRTLFKDGFAYNPSTGDIFIEPQKYLNNLIDMWYVALTLVVGVVLVLYGIVRTIYNKVYIFGIWFAGIGVVMVVLSLLLSAGWNNTAYYPSIANLQSSLTIANSCSSEFTLHTMAVVSLLIPFVLAYIVYAWRCIDKKKLDHDEISRGEAY